MNKAGWTSDNEHEYQQLVKERNKLRAVVTKINALVNKSFVSDDKAERFDELMQLVEDIKEAL